MKTFRILMLIVVFQIQHIYAQDNSNNNIKTEWLVKFSNKTEKTSQDMLYFLSFFADKNNNVELAEHCNEALFRIIQSNDTELFLKVLDENRENLNCVLDEIESPINDTISVKACINHLNQDSTYIDLRKQVITHLNKAQNKLNIEWNE